MKKFILFTCYTIIFLFLIDLGQRMGVYDRVMFKEQKTEVAKPKSSDAIVLDTYKNSQNTLKKADLDVILSYGYKKSGLLFINSHPDKLSAEFHNAVEREKEIDSTVIGYSSQIALIEALLKYEKIQADKKITDTDSKKASTPIVENAKTSTEKPALDGKNSKDIQPVSPPKPSARLMYYSYNSEPEPFTLGYIDDELVQYFLTVYTKKKMELLNYDEIEKIKGFQNIYVNFFYNESISSPPTSFALTIITKDQQKYNLGTFSSVFYSDFKDYIKELNSNNAYKGKFSVTQTHTVSTPPAEQEKLKLTPLGFLLSYLIDIKNFVFANLIMIALGIIIIFSILSTTSQLRNRGANKIEVLLPHQIQGNMDDLIGMEDIKKEVLQLKDMYINQHIYREHGINRPFNIMFSGSPGVGKTKLAGFLAKDMGLPIIFANASNLETGMVGGGANNLKKIFAQANEIGRAIVFLDEAQPLLMRRGRGNNKWEDDTANALLSILDGIHTTTNGGIITIVASNFDDEKIQMDDAMLRRFQMKINFRLPNKKERESILRNFLEKKEKKYIVKDIDLEVLSDITEGLSPAILNSIMDKASMLAIEKRGLIDEELLMQAFERTLIGLTDRQTTSEKQKDRKIIAIHELGHFFARFDQHHKGNLDETKNFIPILKISTEAISKSNALGYVLTKQDKDMLQNRNELEKKIMSLFGGMANEEIFFGKEHLTTGAYDDLKKITNILKHMIVDMSMYSQKKVNYSLLLGEMNEVKKDQINEIEDKSNELYNKTLEVLDKYKPLTEIIYPILMDKYVLTIEDIFSIINEHNKLVPYPTEKMTKPKFPPKVKISEIFDDWNKFLNNEEHHL